MTVPFPSRRQEEWRYADLDALRTVWERFAEPRTITIAAGESFEEVWVPTRDDVQVKRVTIAHGA
jgi:Fe-S cluster assembly protein SufD